MVAQPARSTSEILRHLFWSRELDQWLAATSVLIQVSGISKTHHCEGVPDSVAVAVKGKQLRTNIYDYIEALITIMKELLTLIGPAKERHQILLVIDQKENSINITATYESGDLNILPGTTVVYWNSSFESPCANDPGHLDIGAGDRRINIRELRGIGLGTFLMAIILNWAKNLPEMPVAPIYLAMDDAKTSENKSRRNRFWRKLGFELILDETESYGRSAPMLSSQLVMPELRLADGWLIAELE